MVIMEGKHMTQCAMNGCRERPSLIPLQVDLPHVGCFEVPLCAVHVVEFDSGCIALTEELGEAERL